MRFIDSNVFIHAFLKPNRRLERHEMEIKEGSKNIILRIEDGEEVLTTAVHMSEVTNILEARASEGVREILSAIASLRNLNLRDVTGENYRTAIQTSELINLGVNDTLAYNTMRETRINEIYSFDRDFDGLPEIKRLTQ